MAFNKRKKSLITLRDLAQISLDETAALFAKKKTVLIQLQAQLDEQKKYREAGTRDINAENIVYMSGFISNTVQQINKLKQMVDVQTEVVKKEEVVFKQKFAEVKSLEALIAKEEANDKQLEAMAETAVLEELAQQSWVKNNRLAR